MKFLIEAHLIRYSKDQAATIFEGLAWSSHNVGYSTSLGILLATLIDCCYCGSCRSSRPCSHRRSCSGSLLGRNRHKSLCSLCNTCQSSRHSSCHSSCRSNPSCCGSHGHCSQTATGLRLSPQQQAVPSWLRF